MDGQKVAAGTPRKTRPTIKSEEQSYFEALETASCAEMDQERREKADRWAIVVQAKEKFVTWEDVCADEDEPDIPSEAHEPEEICEEEQPSYVVVTPQTPGEVRDRSPEKRKQSKKRRVSTATSGAGLELINMSLGASTSGAVARSPPQPVCESYESTLPLVVYQSPESVVAKAAKTVPQKSALSPEECRGSPTNVIRNGIKVNVLKDYQDMGLIKPNHLIMTSRKNYFMFALVNDGYIKYFGLVRKPIKETKETPAIPIGAFEFKEPPTYYNSLNQFVSDNPSMWCENLRKIISVGKNGVSGGGALGNRVFWLKWQFMPQISDPDFLHQICREDIANKTSSRRKYMVPLREFLDLYTAAPSMKGGKSNSNVIAKDTADWEKVRQSMGCEFEYATCMVQGVDVEPGALEALPSPVNMTIDQSKALDSINMDVPDLGDEGALGQMPPRPTNYTIERQITYTEFLNSQNAAMSMMQQILNKFASAATEIRNMSTRIEKMTEQTETTTQEVHKRLQLLETNLTTGVSHSRTFDLSGPDPWSAITTKIVPGGDGGPPHHITWNDLIGPVPGVFSDD